jgi:hypothetical protein
MSGLVARICSNVTNPDAGDIYEQAVVKTVAGFFRGNPVHLFGITREEAGQATQACCQVDWRCLLRSGRLLTKGPRRNPPQPRESALGLSPPPASSDISGDCGQPRPVVFPPGFW